LPARMEHGRSCLTAECEVMAPGRERSPTIITPTLAPSSRHPKQASLRAIDESVALHISIVASQILKQEIDVVVVLPKVLQ
jgi:hypothetical protein